jgi:hypothetical protein
MFRAMRWMAFSLSIALFGCGDDDGPGPDAGGFDAAVRDAGSDAGADAGAPDVCDELGLPRVPFRPGTGTRLGDVAGDFTVQELDGSTFTLSEDWSGCESYVFLVHFPGRTDALFEGVLDRLFLEAPRNVRYFVISDAEDEASRLAFAERLSMSLDEGLAFHALSAEDQAFWKERFHFVTDRLATVEGSVSAHVNDYIAWAATPEAVVDLAERGLARPPLPVVFGIDRAQAWDTGTNLAPAVGMDPQLGMAAFLGHFYDYRAALEARLASETATVVSLIDETTTGRVFVREVELPSATEMAEFDTLEIDLAITCDTMNPFGCSEWDRIGAVHLCADGMPCTERVEIGRWITPYWRPGRQHYAIDASPFLAFLREGGTRSFAVELGPDWERPTEWIVSASLRLRTQGGRPRATGGALAFRGGRFDAMYNDRLPFTFTPPAGSTRVELVTILSGHDQTAGENCAEWCDHRHTFTVNGTPLPVIAHEGEIGDARGCAARSREGVIPGQWGNWAQARAYWCPGLPVAARRDDVTAQSRIGEANELTYRGSYIAGAPRGGDIALSAYVIWYEGP